jgi:hypothetical protein
MKLSDRTHELKLKVGEVTIPLVHHQVVESDLCRLALPLTPSKESDALSARLHAHVHPLKLRVELREPAPERPKVWHHPLEHKYTEP